VLFSTVYRNKYAPYLKMDFPRIPFTGDYELFSRLADLGERLAQIHLGQWEEAVNGDKKDNAPGQWDFPCTMGRLYIDESRYFSNIPLELWEYKLCGYRVLYKWLKERRSERLSPGDILSFPDLVRKLGLTVQYQNKIDALYPDLEETVICHSR
jgi:hypothetical protein